MRTTLDIDKKLLDEVVKATGEKTKSKAVSKVLGDYIRGIKIDELRRLARHYPLDDNWRELRAMDLQRLKKLDALREGNSGNRRQLGVDYVPEKA